MRDAHTHRGRDIGREKQAPCREPDAGLDPRSPGSHPEPKAGAQLLSHLGIPMWILSKELYNMTFPHPYSDVSLMDRLETLQILANNTGTIEP